MSFEGRLSDDVREAALRVYDVELEDVHVERPNDPGHGDFATNVALVNAKVFRRNPREVAENLVGALEAPYLRKAGVAGPGFVNFWLSDEALCAEVGALLEAGDRFGLKEPEGEPFMLEYVSVNPTGPMHVGHGRQAAFGDSLSRVLEAAGRPVYREYYFNDGGNQIRLFGESVAVQYAGIYGTEWPVSDPNLSYPGEYVREIAQDLADERGEAYLEMPPDEALTEISAFATRWCMDDIQRTLARVRARFDNYFNEKDLYESGEIEATLSGLERAGRVYESEGALWLDSSRFGDDKDRVLRKRDGSYTYMAPDVAYHRNKYERGFTTAVDVLGADHAGYPPRIQAGLLALGLPEDFYEVELVRLVKLVREGEQVKFSKRAGNFVTLDELLDEVGEDVARYFYVRSSHRSEINFDLELAVKQSDENPVFYVQYAHARIASIFERAGVRQEEIGEVPTGELAPEERQLVLELLDFPRVIQNAADRREVHPIPTYLETLANRFHQFYTVHRVLVDDSDLRARRLALCAASKVVLRTGLELVGVTAPEKM
ncbi:MAG: Arginyl-tRNA synthetase [uncultured Rubrobacteraceae bacterium]|uniref:Arginine--tRNA ligase n=1 Tax=uncultured Rubrobacteraceae bacterium TaxID=349277 RepID=A0A6J4QRK1_9ACTN|nr:MAG: Arginyl-tRNA synthetase [uncultured Rubrobacteraceae bacterium]